MRKGMNSLCGVIHNKMGYDVRLGDVFIFINRQRTTMKLLHAEDGDLVLYIKRLEEGTFRLPEYDQQRTFFSKLLNVLPTDDGNYPYWEK